MIDAIQPILTKVKKDEEELQMDAIRETLKDQFRTEIKVQKNARADLNTEKNDFNDEEESTADEEGQM